VRNWGYQPLKTTDFKRTDPIFLKHHQGELKKIKINMNFFFGLYLQFPTIGWPMAKNPEKKHTKNEY
jgi:hypothetical protein